MEPFHYYLPANLIFGKGTFQQLGEEVKKYGTNAMIVTGRNSTKKTGLLDQAVSLLKKDGISVTVFDQVAPNPLSSTVSTGAELARASEIDVIVGLGGGSIMDCSKAIAFSVCNPGNIFDYIYGRKSGTKAIPLVLVPTTCGTGSEGNSFAVLTDDETKDKKSLRHTSIIAKSSIVDPLLMTTMPDSVLSSVSFDALCHCMEAYISKAHNPISDLMALKGIELIHKYLARAIKSREDTEAFSAISLASTFGGMAINQAGVTTPHGLEHPASGLRNITHGRGLAALTPHIYERSISSCPERFYEISRKLGGQNEHDCVAQIRKLLSDIGLNTSLSQEGVCPADIPWMTENAYKISAVSIQNHPIVFTKEEIIQIYTDAM